MSRPTWRDCDRCNYDLHVCPGCGESLPHGIDVCDVCREAGHTLTTDPFTDAAHTEAKRLFWGGVTRAHDTAMKEARGAFIAGARWARDRLAEQEPTAAEIDAAAAVIWESHDLLDRAAIRDALTAARTARRDGAGDQA